MVRNMASRRTEKTHSPDEELANGIVVVLLPRGTGCSSQLATKHMSARRVLNEAHAEGHCCGPRRGAGPLGRREQPHTEMQKKIHMKGAQKTRQCSGAGESDAVGSRASRRSSALRALAGIERGWSGPGRSGGFQTRGPAAQRPLGAWRRSPTSWWCGAAWRVAHTAPQGGPLRAVGLPGLVHPRQWGKAQPESLEASEGGPGRWRPLRQVRLGAHWHQPWSPWSPCADSVRGLPHPGQWARAEGSGTVDAPSQTATTPRLPSGSARRCGPCQSRRRTSCTSCRGAWPHPPRTLCSGGTSATSNTRPANQQAKQQAQDNDST